MIAITTFIGALGLVVLINVALFLLIAPKVVQVLRNINKLKIDVNNPYLPDYVIHKDQPIRFAIGNKALYLKPMQAGLYTVYIDKMVQFYKSFESYLNNINMDKDRNEFTDQDINALLGLFKVPDARYMFLKILKETIMQDNTINKDKIKWKDMLKMDISEIVQLWIVLYDRNVTCVRSFIASLLVRLGEGSAKQKPGLGLWSLQDNQWMLSQITQSLKQDLSPHAKPNKDNDKKTSVIEV